MLRRCVQSAPTMSQSPNSASPARYVLGVDLGTTNRAHIRAAWDHAHPHGLLAQQDVILTVPASFDEIAREFTVEAANGAGIARATLLEEPQAAFYAWINAQGDAWEEKVQPGQKIL